jgi:hypothetical protein
MEGMGGEKECEERKNVRRKRMPERKNARERMPERKNARKERMRGENGRK